MIHGRRSAPAFLGLALLTPGIAAATDVDAYQLETVRAEYRGSWNRAPGDCAPLSGRYRLPIAANEIEAGGDHFRSISIASDEGGGIGIVSRHAGPARIWTRVDGLKLSADGGTLTDDHAGRIVVRTRCRS
jgi:hypothetical protein